MLFMFMFVDNATCVSNVETPFIIDGRKLKSINQYWNKQKAYLQSIAMKQQKVRTTHQINRLTSKRNNRVNDYIKKSRKSDNKQLYRKSYRNIVCWV